MQDDRQNQGDLRAQLQGKQQPKELQRTKQKPSNKTRLVLYQDLLTPTDVAKCHPCREKHLVLLVVRLFAGRFFYIVLSKYSTRSRS